ncbi:unnamed protein product [Lactuca virosa]|uniref:U-box domain-containing protein n=1 Tax=Lactuca virosa TaxID=75947 RepID=A0AAU9MEZ7_9ASTR|nr:unnamed protein product [Lactuca virosa]
MIIAESGWIPILVGLLTSEDLTTEENLNLSVYDNNRGLRMMENAIPSLVQLLRSGTMETIPRSNENATSILLSLCKRDNENIGCVIRIGALTPLMELAVNGSERGRRKANLLFGSY